MNLESLWQLYRSSEKQKAPERAKDEESPIDAPAFKERRHKRSPKETARSERVLATKQAVAQPAAPEARIKRTK